MMAFKARSIFTTWIRKSKWMGSQNKNGDAFDQCFFANNSNPTISNNSTTSFSGHNWAHFHKTPTSVVEDPDARPAPEKQGAKTRPACELNKGLRLGGIFGLDKKTTNQNQPEKDIAKMYRWWRWWKLITSIMINKTLFLLWVSIMLFFWSPWNLRNLRPSPGEEAVCLPPHHIRAWHPWQPVTQPWQDIRAPWHPPKRIRASMMEDVLCLFCHKLEVVQHVWIFFDVFIVVPSTLDGWHMLLLLGRHINDLNRDSTQTGCEMFRTPCTASCTFSLSLSCLSFLFFSWWTWSPKPEREVWGKRLQGVVVFFRHSGVPWKGSSWSSFSQQWSPDLEISQFPHFSPHFSTFSHVLFPTLRWRGGLPTWPKVDSRNSRSPGEEKGPTRIREYATNGLPRTWRNMRNMTNM